MSVSGPACPIDVVLNSVNKLFIHLFLFKIKVMVITILVKVMIEKDLQPQHNIGIALVISSTKLFQESGSTFFCNS